MKNNYKILIAEDNFVSRKLLNKQLASLGEVDVAQAMGKKRF
jgi:CheY-like chemotaxis protein